MLRQDVTRTAARNQAHGAEEGEHPYRPPQAPSDPQALVVPPPRTADHTQAAVPAADAAPDDVVQLVGPDGVRHPDPEHDPWVADVGHDELAALYEDMVVVRRLDLEATALQRQGELALWPPLLGQEAAQVGSARALRADDFVFSSYRENGVAYCRGVGLTDLVRVWRGTGASGWDPWSVGMATPTIVIGAQTLHATGYALGCLKDGVSSVAVAYFGDGATSQGDVNEAMVFAAAYRAPVVFFCQNNQWAISEPVSLVAVRALADRAPGFGIPSVRVDGNDVLAVTAVTRIALDRARRGEGPTFIEAVTYRRGPHTTSDDPTRYVDPAVDEQWAAKDPILRIERLLESRGRLTEGFVAAVTTHADDAAAQMRRGCLGLDAPPPLSVFDHVYTTPTAWLERQRSQYAAYLAMFDEAADGGTA